VFFSQSCVRQVQQIGDGTVCWLIQVNSDIPLFDWQGHPFVPTCLRSSAAHSDSQEWRRECGGTGLAGAQRS
jgi:hypothetical protein